MSFQPPPPPGPTPPPSGGFDPLAPPPFPGAPMPEAPAAPPPTPPLSVAEEALLGAYLNGLVDNPVLDPAATPTGARVDEWGHLLLDPPFDVQVLAVHWGVSEPIAVSTDPMQRFWYLFQRGAELPDDYNKRVAAEPVPAAGGRTLRARLTGRPDGPLPDTVAGPSPAYDLKQVGGFVDMVEIS